jgi:hypothetical protein
LNHNCNFFAVDDRGMMMMMMRRRRRTTIFEMREPNSVVG